MGGAIEQKDGSPTEATKEVPPTTMVELSQRVTNLVITVRQNYGEILSDGYRDAQDDLDASYFRVPESRQHVPRDMQGRVTCMSSRLHQTILRLDTRISSLEALVTTLVSYTTSLQTHLIAALVRIDTLEARELAHTDDPKDVDSCTSTAKMLLQGKKNQNQNHPSTTATSPNDDVLSGHFGHDALTVMLGNKTFYESDDTAKACLETKIKEIRDRRYGIWRGSCNANSDNNQKSPPRLIRTGRNGNALAKVFDVTIGMDWLAKYYAVIVYDEKLVRIPFGNETLIIHGDGSNGEDETLIETSSCALNIEKVTCLKKDCHVFIGNVNTKKTGSQVEWQEANLMIITSTYLVLYRVARAPYRLASYEMNRIYRSSKPIRTIPTKGFISPDDSSLWGDLASCLSSKEGWIISNVHRLPRIEQANCEESLSTPED
ncbi:hypothetical protein Tco_0232535 [Tanacetum coccineum]